MTEPNNSSVYSSKGVGYSLFGYVSQHYTTSVNCWLTWSTKSMGHVSPDRIQLSVHVCGSQFSLNQTDGGCPMGRHIYHELTLLLVILPTSLRFCLFWWSQHCLGLFWGNIGPIYDAWRHILAASVRMCWCIQVKSEILHLIELNAQKQSLF